jgi:hypothetical protein
VSNYGEPPANSTPLPRIALDPAGVMERAWLPSLSTPDHTYEMVRTVGGWAHTDTKCCGWVERGHCYHITALEGMMTEEQMEETRAIAVSMNPLALLDSVNLEELMSQKLVPSEHHIYSFRVKGQLVEGVSIDGVRDAARALSTKGEAVRELWVHLEREDEREAYFLACSARYAVAPDGREICMDTAIRAKRQPKWEKRRNPQPGEPTEYFVDAWFEIGVAKAARNATEALLPEALKDHIKDQARKLLGTNGNGSAPAPRQEQRPQASPASAEARARLRDILTRAKAECDEETWALLTQELRRQFPAGHADDGGLIIARLPDKDIDECASVVARYIPGTPNPDTESGLRAGGNRGAHATAGGTGAQPTGGAPATAQKRSAAMSAGIAPSSLQRVQAAIERLVLETDRNHQRGVYGGLKERWPDAFDGDGKFDSGRTAVSESQREAMVAYITAAVVGPGPSDEGATAEELPFA